MVEGHHTDVLPQLALRGWSRKGADIGDLAGQGSNASRRHVVSEKVELCRSQEALFTVDLDAVLGETGEHQDDVLTVLFRCVAGDQDVIDVSMAVRNTTEDLIDELL